MSQRYGMDSMAMPGRSLRYARYALAWLQAALCSVSAEQFVPLRQLCHGFYSDTYSRTSWSIAGQGVHTRRTWNAFVQGIGPEVSSTKLLYSFDQLCTSPI